MGFNWEDEADGEFRDMPEGVTEGQPQPVPLINAQAMSRQPQRQVAQPQKRLMPQEEIPAEGHFLPEVEEVFEETEEDYESVLADANLRIRQGVLYQTIMNSDIFDENDDEDPRALENVTREIRKFARERMEIMLGMRQETSKQAMVSSPFNELEVMVLKKLASTYSKGATEAVESREEAPRQPPKKTGLKTISSKPQAAKVAPKAPQQSLASKPKAPIQRQAVAAPAPITDDNYKPLDKPFEKMTAEEMAKRNKEAGERQSGRKAKSTIAMAQPSADQEEMFHTQRVMTSDNPLASPNAVSAIIAQLNKSKSQ